MDSIRSEVGNRIAEIRKKKGLTQRELAEKSGIHYSNIAKIEMGRYSVGIDILHKVLNALNCEVKIIDIESE